MENNLGYNTVVNAIIAASPIIYNIPNVYDTPSNGGYHSVTSADFRGAQVSWFGAQAFTIYLNSINYAGTNQWTLPSAGTNPQTGLYQTSSQFGELFYNELGGDSGGIPPNSIFTNEPFYAYWFGTESAFNPNYAWYFHTSGGYQGNLEKGLGLLYAWAISPGNVAAVPVPAAVWLFGSGLIGLVGLKRRGKIG
jgi:hypothetical protein